VWVRSPAVGARSPAVEGKSPAMEGRRSAGEGRFPGVEGRSQNASRPAGGGEQIHNPEWTRRPLPVTLHKMTFRDAASLKSYFRDLRENAELYKDLDEFHHNVILELLQKGHPNARQKIGPGIKAFQVRPLRVRGQESNAFFLLRNDGTIDDFSTGKCCRTLFPHAMARKPDDRQRTDTRGGMQRWQDARAVATSRQIY